MFSEKPLDKATQDEIASLLRSPVIKQHHQKNGIIQSVNEPIVNNKPIFGSDGSIIGGKKTSDILDFNGHKVKKGEAYKDGVKVMNKKQEFLQKVKRQRKAAANNTEAIQANMNNAVNAWIEENISKRMPKFLLKYCHAGERWPLKLLMLKIERAWIKDPAAAGFCEHNESIFGADYVRVSRLGFTLSENVFLWTEAKQ